MPVCHGVTRSVFFPFSAGASGARPRATFPKRVYLVYMVYIPPVRAIKGFPGTPVNTPEPKTYTLPPYSHLIPPRVQRLALKYY